MHQTCRGFLLLLVFPLVVEGAEPGRVGFEVRDASSGNVVPCRIHLLDSTRKSVKPEGLTLPFWKDHFVCDGKITVSLPAGEYRYEIERGPEYAMIQNPLTVESGKMTQVEESLQRIADLANEGWWSGETHVHRPLVDVPMLMHAEDLHVAMVITWWNDKTLWKDQPVPDHRIKVVDRQTMFDALGGEDERGGGALLFSGLKTPMPITGSKRESPPSVKWLQEAKREGAWVDAEKPFWLDFPVWLSTGQLDSVGVAHNHMHRGGMYKDEAWGRQRDRGKYPEPLGNGFWTQAIYYHALNAGYRLTPSAGSASGVLPNPVGYNRMYAHLDEELSWDNWWAAVRAGRVFVTNGPLLRLTAEHQYPGHLFQSKEALEVTIDGRVDSRSAIAAIELVQDGRVERLSRLPAKIKLTQSGWFLVRALTEDSHTFRFASTAPWYVQIGDAKPPIHREACEFFREWNDERLESLRQKLTSEQERHEVLPVFEAARRFWQERAATASVP